MPIPFYPYSIAPHPPRSSFGLTYLDFPEDHILKGNRDGEG
jgi:hypothetical protein